MDNSPSAVQIGLKQSSQLLAFVAVSWLLLVGPAYLLAGTDALLGLSLAAVLCLIPGVAVCLIVSLLATTNAAAYSIVAATLLRLIFVAGGGLVVRDLRPDLGMREFHLWGLLFYLGTLLFETLLLVKSTSVKAGNTASRSVSETSSSGMSGIQG